MPDTFGGIMIKIQNNTATRESIPSFLIGLSPESLIDLSWTDSQLGVQDCAWWQETHDDAPIDILTHKYGNEILTINEQEKTVSVTHEIVVLSQEELNAVAESKKQTQKTGIEQSLAKFAAEKDFDNIGEASALLSSTNPEWEKDAATFVRLWDETWQAFYNNQSLPELSWL